MSDQKKNQLTKAVQSEMKSVGDRLKAISDDIQKKEFEVKEDTLKDRDNLRQTLKGLSELFDQMPAQNEKDFESEYSLISTDSDDTFLLVYFNPDNNNRLDIVTSHACREDALNKLKDIIEEREGKKKIKEAADA